jgi:hypothetical protein
MNKKQENISTKTKTKTKEHYCIQIYQPKAEKRSVYIKLLKNFLPSKTHAHINC